LIVDLSLWLRALGGPELGLGVANRLEK